MEKLKFALFSIIILTLVALVAYWSITSIQSGTEYVAEQRIKQLEKENEDLRKETSTLETELALLEQKVEGQKASPVVVPAEQKPAPSAKPAPTTTVYKNQSLINELEKMTTANVLLKLKSQGPRVGTVQTFLNLYNKTSNKVDNDYGAGTVSAMTTFQKAEGLTADGEAGPGTFRKMIEWLKKQG